MLKVLPEQISNLIAAGEVVQRPASVVKELMENAVDAGALQVQVIINDSGRTLIQVLDNGCGMSSQESRLSILRHATSKISSAEDLQHIITYGFRGEALASIAACAEVTMITRREEDETATELFISESSVKSETEVSAPKGTNIAVRNLFYNVPARRKFLKSDATELRQIVNEFTKVALTRREVEFKLIHNSKILFHLPPVANLKQRIVQIDGMAAAKDLVDIGVKTGVVSIWGYVGNPLLAKKSQQNQYMFVNGRYFRSAFFNKAVQKAYDKLLPDGLFPSYYLFFEIAPEEMDVNIHPAKTEVKFENESVIFKILDCAVREAIGVGAFMPGIEFDREGVPEFPATNTEIFRHRENIRPPQVNYDPLFNPFDEGCNAFERRAGGIDDALQQSAFEQSGFEQGGFEQSGLEQSALWEGDSKYGTEEEGALSGQEQEGRQMPYLVVGGRYIVTTLKSGLVAVNIAKARERILFEEYMKSLRSDNAAIQESLFPQTAELSANDYALLMENEELIKRIGFDLRPFGENCVVVYGIPAIFAQQRIDVPAMLDELAVELKELAELQEMPQEQMLAGFKERVAGRLVGHIADEPRTNLNPADARMIVESLFACENPYVTPSGRKCVEMITLEELDKRLNL